MIQIYLSKSFDGLKMTILSLFMAGVLSGCGIRGPLKTPPPLLGGAAKVDQNRVPNEDLDKVDDTQDDYHDLGLDVENQDSLADL